ncbi:splicing regulator NSRP1-like domain-containing protein [Aspergillus homomorphus CBS 101889]|uniref:Nuclear speckle splicing regulatory protein 1 N-terminal domain-containing protein n=1 Tax=Aspergillus homomorphus (strain CBS 101889) TaxID=1450537 RepID=A0A395I761_ASPHC|nr:hypothetical protein BO97DRAFT_441167 [Aspergillus homomorphus CBS 101889]RAL15133.1 hypothetical protein BO97DRAFT_441167 [Aspergillus homomorphus CBS 101889]
MAPFGINLSNKSRAPGGSSGAASSNKRKKPIFSTSDSEDDTTNPNTTNSAPSKAIEITTLGGLDDTPANEEESNNLRPTKRRLAPPGTNPAQAPGNNKSIKPLSKTSIFANDSDSETEQNQPAPKTYGLNTTKTTSKPKPTETEYTNLSTQHSSRKHQTAAETVDPSIYSYDSIYDTLHSKPAQKSTAENHHDAAAPEVPKYMTALLRSAEIRKRDQLRARDRQLAKEREAEGDDFADKEKFVTAAYKAQQAELRRIEEEEAAREAREEEDRRKNGGKGMVGFYREMLARGEERHAAVVRAAEEAAAAAVTLGGQGEGEGAPGTEKAEGGEEEEKSEAQVAAELNARGAHVAVNDDGQVVDKRQLLSAGLNVAPKPKSTAQSGVATSSRAAPSRFGANRAGPDRGGQRARQTEMIASQLEERARQEEEAEAARQKEIAERSRSLKSQGDVSSARERYLARKREREAAAAQGKAS